MKSIAINKNNRIEFIDRLKGFAIILVIVGHIIQFNDINGGSDNTLFKIIYSFHMPLFFILSGYVAAKSGSKVANLLSLGTFLSKKTLTLILPLLSWTLVSNKYFFSEDFYTIQFKDIYSVLLHPGLWFLQILFEIQFVFGIFSLLSNYINKNKRLLPDFTLISFLFIIPVAGYLCIDKSHFATVALFTLFFYVGVVISKYSQFEKLMINQHIYGLSLIIFLVLSGHWAFNGNELDDILKIIISISAFIVCLNLSIKVTLPSFVDSQIQLFGKESLAIYIIQFYLTNKIIASNGFIGNNLFINFLLLIICAIPIAYIAILIHRIFEKSSYLDLLFFGKHK